MLPASGRMFLLHRFLAAPLVLASVCAAFFAGSVSGLHAQTIVYRRAIKLPTALYGCSIRPINDSGFGATDVDEESSDTTKHRFLYTVNRFYCLSENGDGTASFGPARTSGAQLSITAFGERHLNKNPNAQQGNIPVLFGMLGASLRYNDVSEQGQAIVRFDTNLLSTTFSIVAVADNLSILPTRSNYNLNGVSNRLVYIHRDTMTVTPCFGDASAETGTAIGVNATVALGPDGNLYVLDYDNLRMLTFSFDPTGATLASFVRAVALDPTRTAINSMTMDLAGNFFLGDGQGGFDLYSRDGQWQRGFHNTYVPDPDSTYGGDGSTARPYMNYYASGLNDGNGTLDISDATGYRQYTILAATGAPVAYAAWQAQYFSAAQQADPTVSDPSAAPQGDGVSNLLKYVFNINPAQTMSAGDRAALPTGAITTSNGTQYLSLAYRQYASLSGVSVSVQTSPDLVTWTTVADPTVLASGTDPVTGDPTTQVGVPVSGSSEFIRLSVTQSQPVPSTQTRPVLSARHR